MHIASASGNKKPNHVGGVSRDRAVNRARKEFRGIIHSVDLNKKEDGSNEIALNVSKGEAIIVAKSSLTNQHSDYVSKEQGEG